MKKAWEDKVVLISGGLGDIALAIALAFGREGAKIALSDIRSEEIGKERVKILQSENIIFTYHRVEAGNATAVKKWIADVVEVWNRIDITVVNAATVTQKNLTSISAEEWESEIQVNLNGAFHLAQQAALNYKENKIRGNIVFLGSWAAHAVHPNIPAYSVSKSGLRMLCQCMALEFAPLGIRVNEIAPGFVNAGLSKEVWGKDPILAESAKSQVPLGMLIEPGDVANQIVWLCGEESKHITGSCLLMDGGLSVIRP